MKIAIVIVLVACGSDKSPVASRASSTPTATPTNRCPDGMSLVPKATFTMGGPDGELAEEIERPRHQVTITHDYCVDRTEVTVEAYNKCVAAGACKPNKPDDGCNHADKAQHPINCIAWEDAAAFCTFSGKRLLTEAEWELAARGTDGRLYPWGNAPPTAKLLNSCGGECDVSKPNTVRTFPEPDGNVGTAPVGSYPAGASPFGLLDMSGNVSEWVADWKGRYEANAVTDPVGAEHSDYGRIIRGGDYAVGGADNCTATTRYWYDFGTDAIGVRCAK
jgi:formylglycine-generating enzyme required for sulfatase activity